MDEETAEGGSEVNLLYKAEQVESESSTESTDSCFDNLFLKKKSLAYGEEQPLIEICATYLPLSDSSVFRHQYYHYPAIINPGVQDALLEPTPPIIFPDDGQALYLHLCKKMDQVPCNLFLKGLLNKHISLSHYGINPKAFRAMALALRRNNIVESIDFTNNFIGPDGCFHIGEILADNCTLKEINFSGCRMGLVGIKRIIAKLRENNSLKKINLAANELGDDGVELLADVIYSGASLIDIDLSYNGLTPNSLKSLTRAIEMNNIVTRLNLSWNKLGSTPQRLAALASVLINNEVFVEIDLSWNSLNTRFSKIIVTIMQIPNLEVLRLSYNNLFNEAISDISSSLPLCKRLETLDLSFNPLTVADAKSLLKMMMQRRVKLKKLLLENVCVDDQFVQARQKILTLKFRKDAVITHGHVYKHDNIPDPDMRPLVLRRAQALCNMPQRGIKTVDYATIILLLNKYLGGTCVLINELARLVAQMGALQIDPDLVSETVNAFPGPRAKGNVPSCDVAAMADYVKRLWPDKKIPTEPMSDLLAQTIKHKNI